MNTAWACGLKLGMDDESNRIYYSSSSTINVRFPKVYSMSDYLHIILGHTLSDTKLEYAAVV